MKTLIMYTLHDYIRSHKYFPPISCFFIVIVVFYVYAPNPVIDSYAVTALFVFIFSTWICMSMMGLDSSVQRQITIVHLKSKHKYYLSKLIAAWLIVVVLIIFTYFFPIIFNKFNEPVTMLVGLVSFLHHILLGTLGIVVASLFSKVVTENTVNGYGGLSVVIIISIAATGIEHTLPGIMKWMIWLIPPAAIVQNPLYNWTGESLSDLSLFPFTWIIVYTFCLGILFLGMRKR